MEKKMENKYQKTEKRAIVQLDSIEGFKMDDGSAIEIENWPEDGNDNIIPVGKPFECSIRLAERLKNAGRIQNYSTIAKKVD